MGEYDDILNIIAAEKTTVEEFKTKFTLSARTHIPRLENALKKEGLEKDEIKDRILKDCLQFWTRQTIMNALGDEYKDSVMQEQGRKGGEKRHEIVIDNTGNVGNSQNNDESPSLNIQASNAGDNDKDEIIAILTKKVESLQQHRNDKFDEIESLQRQLAQAEQQTDVDVAELQIKLSDEATARQNAEAELKRYRELLEKERDRIKELESSTTSPSNFTTASDLAKSNDDDDTSPVLRSTYKKTIGELNTRILELKDKLIPRNFKEIIEVRGQKLVLNITCANLVRIDADEQESRRLNQ